MPTIVRYLYAWLPHPAVAIEHGTYYMRKADAMERKEQDGGVVLRLYIATKSDTGKFMSMPPVEM